MEFLTGTGTPWPQRTMPARRLRQSRSRGRVESTRACLSLLPRGDLARASRSLPARSRSRRNTSGWTRRRWRRSWMTTRTFCGARAAPPKARHWSNVPGRFDRDGESTESGPAGSVPRPGRLARRLRDARLRGGVATGLLPSAAAVGLTGPATLVRVQAQGGVGH
jgi:hypothetical protein